MGYPLECSQLLSLTSTLGYHFGPSWGNHWLHTQRAKGGPLVLRTVKKLSKSRHGTQTRDISLQWVDDMELLWKKRQIVPHAIMPYDETRLSLRGGNKLEIQRITSADREHHPDCQFSRGGVICSMLNFFTINGPFMTFLILPMEFKTESDQGEEVGDFIFMKDYLGHNLRRKWDHYVVFTKKAYLNSEAFLNCAKKVLSKWNLVNPGLNLLLLGDNLVVHRSLEFLKEVLRQGHLSWYIPAQSSNWNAVPDDVLFALLKVIGQKKAERDIWNSMISQDPWKWSVMAAFMSAELEAFSPESCRKAFNNTGLVNKNNRFDGDLVRRRISENLGTFTRSSPGVAAEARDVVVTLLDEAADKAKSTVP